MNVRLQLMRLKVSRLQLSQVLRWGWYALFACLLTGCANLPNTGTVTQVAEFVLPPYRDNIDLQGRLSVKYQQQGKDESLSGSFEWHQQAEQIDLALRSPLGQTVAQIQVRKGLASLTQAGQAPQYADNVDQLATQILGWPLPISGLRLWLQGRAQASDASIFTASPQANTITTLDGWRLRFVSWHPDASPKRIDMERDTVQAGTVELRMVLDPPAAL
jgi:outer membrane lipoprotein LolB